jgi:hypothetical protein
VCDTAQQLHGCLHSHKVKFQKVNDLQTTQDFFPGLEQDHWPCLGTGIERVMGKKR